MENCLVTKLKESVNNNNLCKLDELEVYFENASNALLSGEYMDPETGILQHITLETMRAGDGVNISAHPSRPNIISVSGTGVAFISNKQQLRTLSSETSRVTKFKYDSLKYCPLRYLNLERNNIDLTDVNQLNVFRYLVQVTIPGTTAIGGELSSLSPYLLRYSIYNTNISGNISTFGNLESIEIINVASSPNIEGSLDTLATTILSNYPNRTTNLTVTGNGVITYKSNGDGTGEDVVLADWSNKTITFSGGSYQIV